MRESEQRKVEPFSASAQAFVQITERRRTEKDRRAEGSALLSESFHIYVNSPLPLYRKPVETRSTRSILRRER